MYNLVREEKGLHAYIKRNPVALGLVAKPEDWPWRIAAFAPEAIPKF